jgi:NTP pyrophosphatase (non-canonical NTP hydrolase)
MTQEELDKAEHFTADYYGLDRQMNILQEECAELIQAVSKVRRYGLSREENLIEEWQM